MQTKDNESLDAGTVAAKSVSITDGSKNVGKNLIKRKLTKKQRGFVKDYIKTENATEAAARNYRVANRNVANNIGAENLAKPSIRVAIQEALPDELLAKVHLEGLSAEFKGIPDYGVRHKYLDSAYKLKGSYAAEKHLNINLEVNKEEREKIMGVASKVIENMTHEEVES